MASMWQEGDNDEDKGKVSPDIRFNLTQVKLGPFFLFSFYISEN